MKQFKITVDISIHAQTEEDAIVLSKRYLNNLESYENVNLDWMIAGIQEVPDATGGIVYLYTDGACKGNPGPGGWGAILKFGDLEKELSGGEKLTTNNRMELMGAISGLEAIKQPSKVFITSDSKYLVDSVAKGWVYSWESKGWIKNGTAVPNADLWKRLLVQLKRHNVKLCWIKGHQGHPENERCDKLASNYAYSLM